MMRLLTILVAAVAVLVTAQPAQATDGCTLSSTVEGEILVGTTGQDTICVDHDNVTVYAEGNNSDSQPDFVISNAANITVHGDVLSDGVTPVAPNLSLPELFPNLTVVLYPGTIGLTTVYGTPDVDNLMGNTFEHLDFYGLGGADNIVLQPAYPDGTTITLDGGTGTDNLVINQPALDATPFRLATVASSFTIKGGRGNDVLKTTSRITQVYGGRGYDVCKVKRLSQAHDCERVRLI